MTPADAALYVVATPVGNLSDLTERARRVLGGVDVVYAEDTRRTGRLLEEIGAEPALRSLHEHNEASRVDEILERLRGGAACALVSDAGTPGVSDPGRRTVAAVLDGGWPVVPVPGPSAVTAALSASGLPGDRFTMMGFPPRSGREREAWMERVSSSPTTVVVFESPRRTGALLAAWEERGLGDRTCVLCRELTKMHEEVRRGTVAGLRAATAERELKGEVTLVLAGAEPAGGADRPAEVAAAARSLLGHGWSTRDVTRHLGEVFGVPRNEAYELVLELEAEEGSD